MMIETTAVIVASYVGVMGLLRTVDSTTPLSISIWVWGTGFGLSIGDDLDLGCRAPLRGFTTRLLRHCDPSLTIDLGSLLRIRSVFHSFVSLSGSGHKVEI
jgi:hypothetical protein